jgi:hypothetical protein
MEPNADIAAATSALSVSAALGILREKSVDEGANQERGNKLKQISALP